MNFEVQNGWRFCSADFSVQASGRNDHALGHVLLVREPEAKARWLRLSDEEHEDPNGPELYVQGKGLTLLEALQNANERAKNAKVV